MCSSGLGVTMLPFDEHTDFYHLDCTIFKISQFAFTRDGLSRCEFIDSNSVYRACLTDFGSSMISPFADCFEAVVITTLGRQLIFAVERTPSRSRFTDGFLESLDPYRFHVG